MKKILLKAYNPVVFYDGKNVKLINTDTAQILIYDLTDIYLYCFPVESGTKLADIYFNQKSGKADTVIRSSSNIVLYNFFIFHKGSTFGYNYDKETNLKTDWINDIFSKKNSSIWKKIQPDSILNSYAYKNFNIYFGLRYDTLINQYIDVHSDKLVKKYIPKQPRTDGDSLTLCFSKKLKDLPFSLSPQLDSVENSKLVKLIIKTNPAYIEQYKVIVPGYDFFLEIEELPILDYDKKKLISIFNFLNRKENSLNHLQL